MLERLPDDVPRFRTKVRGRMRSSYANTNRMSNKQLEAIIAYVWKYSDNKEASFDELLEKFVSSMETWWGVPATKNRIKPRR